MGGIYSGGGPVEENDTRIFSGAQGIGGGGGEGGATGLLVVGPNYGQLGDTHLVGAACNPLSELELLFETQAAIGAANNTPSQIELIFSTQGAIGVAVSDPTYQRTYSVGSNSVAQTAGPISGRSDWVNPTNAQGANNGVNATIAGNATAARGGTLDLSYADIPDWTDYGFTLVSAALDFYSSQAGTVAANGDLRHQYDIGGSTVTLQTFTGNVTNAPVTYDMVGIVTDQAKVNALRAHVVFESALGEIQTATCDAVVFRLVVTHSIGA